MNSNYKIRIQVKIEKSEEMVTGIILKNNARNN
jgi:hypothetical protein